MKWSHDEERLLRTLDELEGVTWGPPTFDSALVTRCCALRTRPSGEFRHEDLRIMLDQQIGIVWLLPLAVAMVEHEPLAEGDLYPGELLHAVLQTSEAEWARRPDLYLKIATVISRVLPFEEEWLRTAHRRFVGSAPRA